MFDSLSDRLNGVFKKIRGQGRLDEANIQEGLREVRLALLEADVNFKVVKDFVDRVRERCLGQDVLKSLTPGQQVVKIVHEELVELLGGSSCELELRGRPAVLMMVGLQGSGKTTSTAKLALQLRKQKLRPLLVPADVYRPAAIAQLTTLGKQLDVPVFASTTDMSPVDIASQAVAQARAQDLNVVLLDTAGRLHIDDTLMQELVAIKERVKPQEILLVADAMTGQDAVTVAEAFNAALDVSGVVLTKMDGDARGGAALSIKSVTGKPIKLVGMGEKLSDLEIFHPDRVAGRILGMGDMLTLIEKAEQSMEAEEAEALAKKMQKAQFTLDDFRTQMRRLKKLGSIEGLLKLIPGMGEISKKIGEMGGVPEREMVKVDAIISSMTKQERDTPKIIDKSRMERVAKGCGMAVQDVAQLLKNFDMMQKMMQQMMGGGKDKKNKKMSLPALPGAAPASGKMPKLSKLSKLAGRSGMGMGGMPGMPGMGGMPGMDGLGGMDGAKGGPSDAKRKKAREKRKKKKKR